ncbi:MAG: PQQ-binding-like beta-propeller repeat protein [Acidimicrobiales bacterium]
MNRRAVYRRRRITAGLAGAVIVLAALALSGAFSAAGPPGRGGGSGSHDGGNGDGASSRNDTGRASRLPAAAESGTLSWQLPNPISREAVLASSKAAGLLIAGGITATGSSSNGVFELDTTNGALRAVTDLPDATHDVAGAGLGQASYLFGGGTTSPTRSVQKVTGGSAHLVGELPEARADSQALRLGDRIYLIGGYRQGEMDGEVLATTDGHSFSDIARLPVPVRYPAIAASGSTIYVFGGETIAGRPVDAVQAIDVSTKKARLVARLPEPLGGAVAANLKGTIYVAGGATTGGEASGTIYAFQPKRGRLLKAGVLRIPVAYAGAAVTAGRLWILGGEPRNGRSVGTVQMVVPNAAFGRAGEAGAGSPYFGDRLLVADRGNNRLLLLSDTGKILWRYPSARRPAPPGGFYFPDDAFFIDHGRAIISNQEENETVVEIAYPSGKLLWQYGHPHHAGSAPGYLNNPDDAYLLRNGQISVADPMNCRVVIIDPSDKKVLHQIGTPGTCEHAPPRYLGSPNGDTPLADGNLLVSEINGSWIDEYTTSGRLVWDVHLPSVAYPSDPQPVGRDRYIVADYARPGAFVEFNRRGRILYRYSPSSGPGELNQPSLVEMLPSGALMANDDYNDRMVAIDPHTGALVWQYGVDGRPGKAPGLLNTPDGFDVLAPGGTTPTHTATG